MWLVSPPHLPGTLNSSKLRRILNPTACKHPKILVDCNNLTALATREPRSTSCQTMVAGYVSAREGWLGAFWMPEFIVWTKQTPTLPVHWAGA